MDGPPLPPRQRAVLDVIRAYHTEHGSMPGPTAIARLSGFGAGTVNSSLRALASVGALEVPEGEPWSTERLRLPAPRSAEDHVRVPK
nr:hypothetical protein [Kineosporia babensis]